jgi:hypothetical protein
MVMGDIADMMLDGTLCEGCGVFLDEDNESHVPRRCRACQESEHIAEIHHGTMQLASEMRVTCKQCGKRVKHAGLKDHQRAKHGLPPSEPDALSNNKGESK